MAELEPLHGRGFQVRRDQPLIGIPLQQDDEEVIQYFTDEDQVESATTPASVRRALAVLGSWNDIDSDDALAELDCRSRDAHCWAPPPQIPACGIPAPGSCVEY